VPGDNENGCFVFSHDYPSQKHTDYNTTADLLELLQEEWIQPFITAPNKLHIALCFKVDSFNPCDGSSSAQNWTALVDELFGVYESFLSESGAQVEFILDGSGTAGNGRTCLVDKWRPWNYTWIEGNDPQGDFWSNSVTNGSDRFQIMNTPVPDDGISRT
jgi:hypothetical protein